jgi:hypothetical protein
MGQKKEDGRWKREAKERNSTDVKCFHALRQTLRAQRSAPQAGGFSKIGISRFLK